MRACVSPLAHILARRVFWNHSPAPSNYYWEPASKAVRVGGRAATGEPRRGTSHSIRAWVKERAEVHRKELILLALSLFAACGLYAQQSAGSSAGRSRPRQTHTIDCHAATANAAPPTVQPSGVVRTASGTAVPGATVRLLETSTGRAWLTWTDENGKFVFPALPAGHYRVEVSQLGFDTLSKELDLGTAAPTPIALTLAVATLAELNAAPSVAAPQ